MLGQTLAHYRVVERIGAGGMGVVYRARDERLDRDVALKVLPAGALADDIARKRFQTEALALSRLNHPHICTIYDVGEVDGQVYIAMEYIEGRPLSELASGQGLPAEAATRYGVQIAQALAHAHERGITHRDLKGSNVIITSDGRAKVLDFGLAKRSAEKDSADTRTQGLTEAGVVLGTLSHMAPELLRGEPADSRSDLWALGVVLYQAVSGQPPFQGKTGFEISSAILREPPPPLPGRLPPLLQAAILRCLAKEPGERYQRASEVQAVLEAAQAHPTSTTTAVVPPKAPPGRRWVLTIAAALAALLALLLALDVGGLRERFRGAPDPGRIQSLAVLPLENLSRDPEQDYFADGMTEALITDLSKIASLRVISRTSVMQYKGVRKPLPVIARELGVDAVVEGSVLRSGDRVRITTQLIHAATDRHLWAESYDRDLHDVLMLQSEVARTVAREIKATLTPQEQARLASGARVDPEVYRLSLQGRYHANKLTEQGLKIAVRYFDQAIEIDPNYAPAYAGLALAYSNLSSAFAPPREVMPKAKEAAFKALRLDETLSEAHTWLGFILTFFDWDWPGAERELQRALALNPSSAEAHLVYSNYLMAVGRREESFAAMKRAQELDPLSLMVRSGPAGAQWLLFMERRYDEAIEHGRKTLEIEPNFAWAYAGMGMAYTEKRQFPEAIAAYQKAVQLENSPMPKAFLAHGYAAAGKAQEAQTLLRELEATYTRSYLCAYEIAAAYVALGNKDQAFAWLDKAVTDRADCVPWLSADPRMVSLHSDPRFQKLLDRVGLVRRRDGG